MGKYAGKKLAIACAALTLAMSIPLFLPQRQASRSPEFGIPLSEPMALSSLRRADTLRQGDLSPVDSSVWSTMRLFAACGCRGDDETIKVANAHFCGHTYIAYTPMKYNEYNIQNFGKFVHEKLWDALGLNLNRFFYGERHYRHLSAIIRAQDSSLLFIEDGSYDAMLLSKSGNKLCLYRVNADGEKKLAKNRVFSSFDSLRASARESALKYEKFRNSRK